MGDLTKYFALPRYERLIGLSELGRSLEAKKQYFLDRAKNTKDYIDSNTFLKIAKIIELAIQNGARSAAMRIDRTDSMQPVLGINFDFCSYGDMMRFEKSILMNGF